MLYRIRCHPIHPLYGELPVPYVPVLVTRGAMAAHRNTDALPPCRTSQYRGTFINISVSLWNDLANPVFDGVGLACFKSLANPFYWPILVIFSFLFFLSIGWYCGARVGSSKKIKKIVKICN